jgi:hypothetical protein
MAPRDGVAEEGQSQRSCLLCTVYRHSGRPACWCADASPRGQYCRSAHPTTQLVGIGKVRTVLYLVVGRSPLPPQAQAAQLACTRQIPSASSHDLSPSVFSATRPAQRCAGIRMPASPSQHRTSPLHYKEVRPPPSIRRSPPLLPPTLACALF